MSDISEVENLAADKALIRAGVKQPYQALLWAPRKFRDFTTLVHPSQFPSLVDQKVLVRLRLTGTPETTAKGRFSVRAEDQQLQRHRLSIFGALKYSPWKDLEPGAVIHIETKIVELDNKL